MLNVIAKRAEGGPNEASESVAFEWLSGMSVLGEGSTHR
jgi:hypothetical protein